ncbi:MAG: PHP domain-containing protein [Anaerolineales bacterium]
MGLADLHIHTTYSFDGTSTVNAVLKKAGDIGLNVIAITDHDEIQGSLEAVKQAPAYGLEVIPGSEITTAEGHLLALYIHQRIPKGLSLEETIRHVADQNGVCIAPHPGGMRINSLRPEVIRRALQKPDLAKVLIGIEVYNAGIIPLNGNTVARQLAEEVPVARVGSSDAHLLWMIGKGATFFQGSSAEQLRRALFAGLTRPVESKADPRLFLAARWLSGFALRRAGWVSSNDGPQAPLRLARQA